MVNLAERIRRDQLPVEISIVIASRECKGVTRAAELGLTCEIVRSKEFAGADELGAAVFAQLRELEIGLVIFGGYLSRIAIPDDYIGRVMNIHPSLIPAFSGKGFYGDRVHRAALERGVKLSGCTVHFVDNEYDHGPIILQRTVPVLDDDTPDSLASRVFEQECEAYPEAVRLFAEGRLVIRGHRVIDKGLSRGERIED